VFGPHGRGIVIAAPLKCSAGADMRRRGSDGGRLVLLIFMVLALLSGTAGAAGAATLTATVKDQAITYSTESLTKFLQHRQAAPAPFDWSSDGCSTPMSVPLAGRTTRCSGSAVCGTIPVTGTSARTVCAWTPQKSVAASWINSC